MATEIRFGIVIAAKDAATSVARGAASGIKGAFGTIADTAAKARGALGSIFTNLANLKAGFDMAAKGAKLVSDGLRSLVGASLESRAASDKQKQDLERYNKELERTKALAGDILLPIILGLADAFSKTTGALDGYLKSNREIIATKLTGYLVETAQLLVSGVGLAVLGVTRAWTGWREIITLTAAAAKDAFYETVLALASLHLEITKLVSSVDKDLGASMARTGLAVVKGLGPAEHHLDRAVVETARLVREQEELEKKLAGVQETLRKTFDEVAVAVAKRASEQIARFGEDAFETWFKQASAMKVIAAELRAEIEAERDEADRERLRKLNKELEEYQWVEASKRAAAKETADKVKADQAELASTISGYFSSIRSIAVSAFADIGLQADGTRKTVGDAFGQLFGGIAQMVANQVAEFVIGETIKRAAIALTAKQAVAANAANAASGAAASQAGIPVVGPVLAIAAMGAMLAAVLALSGGFERGGVLGAGMAPSSRDNLIFAGAAGEGVLTTDTTQRIARDLSGRGGPGSSPTPPSPSRSGRGTTYVLKSLYPPSSRADLERVERDVVGPAARRLRRLGHEV